MSLTSGSTLGHYEILTPLGAGGMGEVYRARDTKLGREVAIKVIPDEYSQNEERLARFGREAKLLAALNHPNIATLHGLEMSGGTRFLVMELVEGETLAERIAAGPIPLEVALPVFEQVAAGLQAAHEKAVIHRDLKPANIKITPDGKVKVLDFGLAKAFDDEVPATELSHSPTITRDATRAGVILGTAAYMSPEQARGKPVDKRTDIWSFGCVVFETLTGQKAFLGETATDTIAAIVRAEPRWDALPNDLPARVRDLLARCLRKDPARRLHDMADVRLDIEDALQGPEAPVLTVGTMGGRRSLALAFLAGAFVASVAAGLAVSRSRPDAPRAVSRLHVTLPETDRLTSLLAPVVAFSPDGTRLAYVANDQIYLRALDALQATPVPATEGGGRNPFFSPNGEWLGFWKDDSLQKVRISGGAAVTLCAAANPNGVRWGSDDMIAFQQPGPSIRSVSASGGSPETLVSLDSSDGLHGGQILPGGEAILFTLVTSDAAWDEGQIIVQSLESGERHVLIEGGRDARYLPTGHIVYASAQNLMAAPFNAEELQLVGEPVPVVEGVLPSLFGAASQFTVSDNGSLAYVPFRADVLGAVRTLVWVDREGVFLPVSDMQAGYEDPRISPDGRRLAYSADLSGGLYQVWTYDLERGSRTLLTYDRLSYFPVWTPDGSRVAFTSQREGFAGLYWTAGDGSGTAELLTRREENNVGAFSWSPDGKALAFWERRVGPEGPNDDVWILSQSENDWVATPFVETPFNELSPMFSPDGRWLAYVSNETGQNEVYVQPYPDADRKSVVSTEGGSEPRWSRDGRELFYRNEDQMLVVAVSAGSDFNAGKPKLLFEGDFGREPQGNTNYDVHPDGTRFLMVRVAEAPPLRQITVVLNWFSELERLVPTSN